MLYDWFKILKNLKRNRDKTQVEIHAILRNFSFPFSRMESEGTILQCASSYMKEVPVFPVYRWLAKGLFVYSSNNVNGFGCI